MVYDLRSPSYLLLFLVVLGMGGCATTRYSYDATAAFPVPDGIRDNVDFWRRVYGEWSRSQVAFHDDRYLGVIYEVAELPGGVRGRYTEAQKRWINRKKSAYRRRLAALERKVAAGRALDPEERVLYEKLVAKGGRSAVFGAADRLRIQRGIREKFRRGLEISGRYDSAFRAIFRSRGLPEDLAFLPHVESSFQSHARSSVGAAGIWQFMPATGRVYRLQVNRDLDERLDPILAAEGAARYLAAAYRKLGSWPLAITSYNHGQGGMAKAKRLHGADIGHIVQRYRGPYFGFASRNFYAEFLAAREVARHPDRYFPEGIAYEPPVNYDRLVLHYTQPAARLAKYYGVSLDRLTAINPAWRTPITRGTARVPAGSTVWMPAGVTRRIASQPGPLPVRIARVEPKPPAPATVPSAPKPTKSRPPTKVRAKPKKPAHQLAATPKKERLPKTHVVQPNETLYRVALRYAISIEKLRKLNRMKPDDNLIRVGQKLRVRG